MDTYAMDEKAQDLATRENPPRSTAAGQQGAAPRRKAKGRGSLSRIRQWSISIASIIAALMVWQLLSSLHVVPAVILPGPLSVVAAGENVIRNGYQGVSFWVDLWASVYRIMAGFLIACITAIPLGLVMGTSQVVRAFVNPLIQLFRPLPPLAYLSILIIWFGIGDTSRIALLYLAAMPVLVISAMQAAMNVSIEKQNVARSLGASRWQVFLHVILRASVAEIMIGIRVATGVTFTTLVAAEMIAANTGIGAMNLNSSRYLQSDVVFFTIVVLGVMGMLLDVAVVLLDKKLVPWRGRV